MRFIKKIFGSKELKYLRLTDVVEKNNQIFFYLKGYSQVKPYCLSAQKVAQENILHNIHPHDSYLIAWISHQHHNKNNCIDQVSFIDKKIILSQKDDEISGDLWDMVNNPEILGNCNGETIKALINHAYHQGRESGMQIIQQMNNQADNKNTIEKKGLKDVIFINKKTK